MTGDRKPSRADLFWALVWVALFLACVFLAPRLLAADLMRPGVGTVADHKLKWTPGAPSAGRPQADFYLFRSSPAGVHPPVWTIAFALSHASSEYTVPKPGGGTKTVCCKTPSVVDKKMWWSVAGCVGPLNLNPPCATSPQDGKCILTGACSCCSSWDVEHERLELFTTVPFEQFRNLRETE